jgi:NADH-quinone oxidoreductase subunit M
MIKRVIFGDVTNEKINDIQDISAIDLIPLMILAIMVLAMGVYPEPLMNLMYASINDISKLVFLGAGI